MKNLIYFFIILIFTFSGCDCNKQKINGENTKITVAQWGQEKYLIYLPFYVAMEKGFFKEEGLDISLKFSGNDDQVFATVLKGEAQFGIGDPVFTAISRERGAKGKVVASIVNGVALWGVTKNKELSILSKPSDFDKLRIGTYPAPSTTYTLMKDMIESNNLKDAKIVQSPIGTELALIESNGADIVMMLEPGASIAESKGYKIVTSLPNLWGQFAFTGLTTTEDYIFNQKDIVKKVVLILEKTLKFIHKDPNSCIEIAIKLFPQIEETVVKNAVNRMIKDETIPKTVIISDDSWQKSLKVRVSVGDLKEMKPTSDAFDNSFIMK